MEDHVDVNFFIWLDVNLSNKDTCTNRLGNWFTVFAVTLWNLWKMRNELQFNDIVICENSVARNSLLYANDISMAFNRGTKDGRKGNETLIKWLFPPAGCVKINTNGSSSSEGSRGSFGGLVRTDQGKWVEGFCGYIGYADALKAELWGIRHALKMCKDKNWRGVNVESDCLVAIKLINEDDEENDTHPNKILIEDCKEIKAETNATLMHILREANRCADVLAKMGAEQNEEVVRMIVPPSEVVEEMLCDLRGVAYGRGT